MQETLQHFILHYGYSALFILLAAGIVGLPVPDEILMTFVGYLTSIALFNFWLALFISFAGAMSGMIVSYTLGKKVGKPVLFRYGKWVKLTPARLNRAEIWFQKYGLWTVCFGYFVPGVRHFTCYWAGVSGVKFWRYLLFAGSGALIWCATFITLGHFLGNSMEHVIHLMHKYLGYGFTAIIITAFLITCIVLIYKQLKQKARN
ncbi:MAG: rane phosphatase-like protein [Bacilli bacterium]|nr:rane phosphatase-like protein [Bacilli bacterium]